MGIDAITRIVGFFVSAMGVALRRHRGIANPWRYDLALKVVVAPPRLRHLKQNLSKAYCPKGQFRFEILQGNIDYLRRRTLRQRSGRHWAACSRLGRLRSPVRRTRGIANFGYRGGRRASSRRDVVDFLR